MQSERSIHGIQYLRGIAALMVVLHHARDYFGDSIAHAWNDFGARGVDIFFVISGFIMAYSTRHFDSDRARGPQARDFLVKRIIRVVPLYWIAILVGNRWALSQGIDVGQIATDFLFLPHFNRSGDVGPVFYTGWTINYEMFFYALFAASMLLGKFRIASLCTTMVLLVVARFALHPQSAGSLFVTASVLIEFVLGIGVYRLFRSTLVTPQYKPVLWFLGAAAFVPFLLPVAQADGLLLGPPAAVIVWVFAVSIDGKSNRTLHLIGDASYSIYLFHQATFNTAKRVCDWLHLRSPEPFEIVAVLSVHLAIAVAAGVAIHLVIERPLVRYLRERSEARLSRAASPVR